MLKPHVKVVYFSLLPVLQGGWEGEKQTHAFCLSGWKSVDNVPKLVNDYMAKKIKVDEFVTYTLPFDKINEAFELMHAGKR